MSCLVCNLCRRQCRCHQNKHVPFPLTASPCSPPKPAPPQDAAQLWEGGCGAMDCQSSWYFGSQGLDLGALGGGGATLAMPLDSRGVAATLCDEEDDILLDNLNLGVIDVSF